MYYYLDSIASITQQWSLVTMCETEEKVMSGLTSPIGVARGGQGRAFALPSLNFALPSKVAKQVN